MSEQRELQTITPDTPKSDLIAFAASEQDMQQGRITTQPEHFRTTDGFKFEALSEAECHQDCLEAIREFESAQQRLFAVIAAKHYVTADGKPFTLAHLSYWIVVESFYNPPCVIETELRWYSSQATYFFRERDQMLCIKWKQGDKEFERPVSEFFTTEIAAREFALRRYQQHIDWWWEDLKTEEKKLAKLTSGNRQNP